MSSELADAAALSNISQSLTCFKSPCPRVSWDSKEFQNRCAYVRTTNDHAFPFEAQNKSIEGSGVEWIVRDIDTGHNPQLAAPEKLCSIIVELAKHFEKMA